MSHYKGSATLKQGQTTVAIYCFYDGATSKGSETAHWKGWFSDDNPVQELSQGEAHLELLDGRTGTIMIDELESSPPFGGTFTGVGAEP